MQNKGSNFSRNSRIRNLWENLSLVLAITSIRKFPYITRRLFWTYSWSLLIRLTPREKFPYRGTLLRLIALFFVFNLRNRNFGSTEHVSSCNNRYYLHSEHVRWLTRNINVAYLAWSTPDCTHDLALSSWCEVDRGSSLRLPVTGPRGWWWWWWCNPAPVSWWWWCSPWNMRVPGGDE